MDDDNETMLEFIQELKNSPEYPNNSETTKNKFDLWEKALSGDAEALTALSMSRGLYDNLVE
jgi:hypothetical protein